MSKLLPGADMRGYKEGDPLYLIASNGYIQEVVEELPDWSTQHWYLRDDPRIRADWTHLRGYKYTAPNKLSKKDFS
jgi:hypothetical protein